MDEEVNKLLMEVGYSLGHVLIDRQVPVRDVLNKVEAYMYQYLKVNNVSVLSMSKRYVVSRNTVDSRLKMIER